MALTTLDHTKRNYILCAAISAILVVWNFGLLFFTAESPIYIALAGIFGGLPRHAPIRDFFLDHNGGIYLSALILVLIIIDIVCILRLSRNISLLRHNPEEKHSRLAIATLLLAFLPSVLAAILIFCVRTGL